MKSIKDSFFQCEILLKSWASSAESLEVLGPKIGNFWQTLEYVQDPNLRWFIVINIFLNKKNGQNRLEYMKVCTKVDIFSPSSDNCAQIGHLSIVLELKDKSRNLPLKLNYRYQPFGQGYIVIVWVNISKYVITNLIFRLKPPYC